MDKVEKICEAITKETLEPAKKQAKEVVEKAKQEALNIVEDAKKQAQATFEEAKQKMQQERSAQETSLKLAVNKSIDKLKYAVEQELFSKAVDSAVTGPLKDSKLVAKIIESMVEAIKSEGIDSDLQLVLSDSGLKSDLSKLVKAEVWKRLEKSGVALGNIKGGVQVKIVDKDLTLDMSQEAIAGLLASFVRDEVRALILNYE